MADKQLNRAEQQLAEANQKADKITKQLFASVAHAKNAEQQSAEKVFKAKKRIQKAVECAAQLEQKLEQKFMDAVK